MEDDTHLCLVCQETIVGLLNYVQHKKSGCRKKADFEYQTFSQDSQFPHAADHAYTTVTPNSSRQNAGIGVDITAPLASFIDSAFSSAVDGSIDASTVLGEAEGSSQSIPDFFQSLELERKRGSQRAASSSGKNSRKRRGMPFEIHADLPITMILSQLEFSSDEDLPVDELALDLDSWDNEWIDARPQLSHVGGKWKSGQGSRSGYSPYQPTGGKWKPGQRPRQRQQRHENVKCTKPSYCTICKLTFVDRISYDEHLGSTQHKTELDMEKRGSRTVQNQSSDDPSINSWVLDPLTGEMVEVLSLPNAELQPPTLLKRGRDTVVKCDVCSLFFDTVKVYELHCDTALHKQNEGKKARELCCLMMNEPPKSPSQATSPQTVKCEKPSVETDIQVKQTPSQKDNESKSDTFSSKPEIHFCVVCDKTFARKYELAYHLLTPLHMRRAFQHPKALEMLDKYSKYVIRLFPYQCNICRFYFNRPSDLTDHLQSENHIYNCQDLVGPLMCMACKHKTDDHSSMVQHVQSSLHTAFVKSNRNICIIRECHSKITCRYCGVIMRSAVRMKRHIEFRHEDRKNQENLQVVWQEKDTELTCPYCPRKFFKKYDLRLHYQRKHATACLKICEPCNRSFASLRTFQHHLETRFHKNRMESVKKAEQSLNKSKSNYASQKVKSDSHSKSVDLMSTQGKTRNEEKKNKEKKSKTKRVVIKRQSGRVTSRPRWYKDYSSDDSREGDGHEKKRDEEEDDEDFNSGEDISKAIETVLQHEKLSESGAGDSAEGGVQVISSTEVGQEGRGLTEAIGLVDLGKQDTSCVTEEEMSDGGYSEEDSVEASIKAVKMLEVRIKDNPGLVKEMRVFPCKFCEFSGNDLSDIHKHALDKHPKETTQCESCNLVFLTRMAFKVHCAGSAHQKALNKHGGMIEEQHTCPHCGKKYPDEIQKNLHVEFVHLHVSTEEGVAKLCQGRDMVTQLYGEHLKQIENLSYRTQGMVACPDCGKFFMKNGLVEHLRSHTNERPYKCRHCVKCFPSPNTLRRHLLTDHIATPLITCEECGKQFKRNNVYNDHKEIHKNKAKGLKWACELCSAVFYLEKCLDAHVKRHGERKFHCKVEGCHYAFVYAAELKEHMYTHTREKKYLCDICGHEEGTKTRLRRHEKSHQPRHLFPCDYCPYKANSKCHLQRHMRIHIGSKPFRCLYCSYTCNTGGNMRKHILNTRKHEGLSLYPCKFCDFGCNEAKDFKQHLHQHHMDYVKQRASEPLVVFTGLYHAEEDMDKVPEGGEIHQVMKGRFVKIYDGTRLGAKGESFESKKKIRIPPKHKLLDAGEDSQQSHDLVREALEKSKVGDDSENSKSINDLLSEPSTLEISLAKTDPEPASLVYDKPYPTGPPWQLVSKSKQGEGLAWVPISAQVNMQSSQLTTDCQLTSNQCTPDLGTISIMTPGANISVNSLALEPGTYHFITNSAQGPQALSVRVLSQQ